MELVNRCVRTSARALLGVALVAASGCELFTGPGRPDVKMTLSGLFFPRPATVGVMVLNQSSRTWYTSTGCNFGIERQVDGVWTSVYSVACLAALRANTTPSLERLMFEPTQISPLETEEFVFMIPADAALGQHRVRLTLTETEYGAGDVYHFTSPVFTVTDGPIDFLRH